MLMPRLLIMTFSDEFYKSHTVYLQICFSFTDLPSDLLVYVMSRFLREQNIW